MGDENKADSVQEIIENVPSPQELLAMRAAICRKGHPEQFVWDQWEHLRCKPGDEKYFSGRNLRLEDFQWDIMQSAFSRRYKIIAIKGCTGAGKGHAAALLANTYFDVFDDAQIVISGPSFGHVKETMMAEIRSLRQKMSMPWPATENIMDISDKNPKHKIIVRVPKSGEGFSGIHSENVLFIFDEASGMEEFMFTNALRQCQLIVVLSNPRTTGWFRSLFGHVDVDTTKDFGSDYGLVRCVTVSMEDLANVRFKRLGSPVAPDDGIEINGRMYKPGEPITSKDYQEVKPLIDGQSNYSDYRDLMKDPREFNRRVFGFGQFPREDEDSQLIFESWLPRHVGYWLSNSAGEEIPIEAMGLDVAVSKHGDRSALAMGSQKGCRKVITKGGAPIDETAQWVIQRSLKEDVDLTAGKIPVCIDTGGGYGEILVLLQQRGVWCIGAHPTGRPEFDRMSYDGIRTEMYGELAKRLDPRGKWPDPRELEEMSHEQVLEKIDGVMPETVEDMPWALPQDDGLHAELLAQKKIVLNDGIKFKLIPKRQPHYKYLGLTVAEQLGKGQSPDKSDAVALLYRAVMFLAREGGGPRYTKVDRPLLLLTAEEQRTIAPAEKVLSPADEMLARLELMDRLEDARF